ncbi:MAG: methylmalonyl Co-A mutase-associated GTPase MeaB [Candidatus Kapaibacteriota bacterium]
MTNMSANEKHYPMKDLIQDIKSGNRRALSKAISLAESSLDADRLATEELLNAVISDTGKAKRIGITGSPGVGKSTFIETFGLACIDQGEKVAVLAIDPSSQSHGGSILGDKVRMPILARSEHAYIRPSPSRLTLGGVSNATREALLLCEAAGFSTIIIETVGVGQSEVEVRSITDLFLLLMLPNAGDEVQGIKRGIMELSDILFINKADGDLLPFAEIAKGQAKSALTLMHSPTFGWDVPVLTGSGLQQYGIDDLLSLCNAFFDPNAPHHPSIVSRRAKQAEEWFELALHRELILWAERQQSWNESKQDILTDIHNKHIVPSIAARSLIKKLFNQ